MHFTLGNAQILPQEFGEIYLYIDLLEYQDLWQTPVPQTVQGHTFH